MPVVDEYGNPIEAEEPALSCPGSGAHSHGLNETCCLCNTQLKECPGCMREDAEEQATTEAEEPSEEEDRERVEIHDQDKEPEEGQLQVNLDWRLRFSDGKDRDPLQLPAQIRGGLFRKCVSEMLQTLGVTPDVLVAMAHDIHVRAAVRQMGPEVLMKTLQQGPPGGGDAILRPRPADVAAIDELRRLRDQAERRG